MTSESQVERVRESPETYGHIFQVCPSEAHYGRGFIRFLDDALATGRWQPANRRLVFLETPVPSGQMTNELTIESAERSGWTIDRCEIVPTVGAHWDAVVSLLDRVEPAAVMITQFLPGELAAFQRCFAAKQRPTLVYAVYTPSIPQFLDEAGRQAEGLVWSTVTGTYSDPLAARFNGRYTKAYGRPPGRSHAGIAYDEVHLLAHAWASVANPRSFTAVAQHLRETTHRGVNGSYFLENAGQCGLSYPDVTLDPSIGQAHLVFQIQDGEHRILSPPPYAEASFRLPPWMVP
jgi:branched-chain amino acid transport system substrate-binding protein